jgi:hypothetical protein
MSNDNSSANRITVVKISLDTVGKNVMNAVNVSIKEKKILLTCSLRTWDRFISLSWILSSPNEYTDKMQF